MSSRLCGGGLCDFGVTPVPIGLGFGFWTALGLGLGLRGPDLGLGLTNRRQVKEQRNKDVKSI